MARRFIILRTKRRLGAREPFAGRSLLGGSLATGLEQAIEPLLEAAELSPREVCELGRDPGVVALSEPIPIRLIRPVPVAGAAAGDALPWGIQAVGAGETGYDGSGVPVAVLDTGIDKAHPAFGGVALVEKDFTGEKNGDRDGHGSHCAGTIFGRDVGGTRIGVARGVGKAFIGKVIGAEGGSSEMLFSAMHWAIEQGARVLSMSLGFDFPGMVGGLVKQGWPADMATSVALEAYRGNLRFFDALMGLLQARSAVDGGAVVVAAAGNESRRELRKDYEIAASLPAAAQGVLSVGALQRDAAGLAVASFSNTYPQLVAPGVGILSARAGGGLVGLSGTSMATPHVAGVAALWWQALQGQGLGRAEWVVAKILSSARTQPLKPGEDPADRGMGIVTAP